MSNFWIIVAFVLGWIIAQIVKIIIMVVRGRGKVSGRDVLNTVLKSGGMPSGHAASTGAAALMIGYIQGFNSAVFMLALCVLFTVLYDAVNVRWAVGVQGKILNKLSNEKVRVVEGHTLAQVVMGLLIAVGVSTVLYIVVK